MDRRDTGPAAARAGGVLEIDLDAVAWNYRRVAAEAPGAACGAAVKADAYGLGAHRLAPVLAREGADPFFVATLDEGVRLRNVLTHAGCPEPAIHVLNGPVPGEADAFIANRLTPVLNSLRDIDHWAGEVRRRESRLPAAVHLDTGMSRLGLPDDEQTRLIREPERLSGVALKAVISHLACADEADNPENGVQLSRFRKVLQHTPPAPRSLANSSGIFLGPAYHFDLVRPGVALYGVNPTPHASNPMRPVVRWRGRVLQTRWIDPPRSVGYGAAFRAGRPTRIATVGVGYADGLPRALSNVGTARIAGHRVPIAGRISMDSVTLDITDLPDETVRPGGLVDLADRDHDLDAVAAEAGTTAYELLTRQGSRVHRIYHHGAQG